MDLKINKFKSYAKQEEINFWKHLLKTFKKNIKYLQSIKQEDFI